MPVSDLVVKGRPDQSRGEPAGASQGRSDPAEGGGQVVAGDVDAEAPDAGCVRS
jgi:hypothetical protein